MKTLLFILLSLSTYLVAQDTWKPADNPAQLVRTISVFTEPSAFLDIKAEFPERLEVINFKEGETIKGDQKKILIASQNNRQAEIALDRTKATFIREEAALKKKISEKAIQVRDVKYRELEMRRLKGLSKEGKVSRASFDLVDFEFERAKLQLVDMETAIDVQKQVINEQKVSIKKAEEDLSRFNLYAPEGWILNERFIEPGSWVKAGEKICQLVDIRTLSVYVRLNEEELESLKKNPLNLKMKRSQKSLKAKIHRVDLVFDPISRKRLVEMRIDAKELGEAAGGIELQLKLKVPYPKPAVEIPNHFIFRKLEQNYIKLQSGEEIALIPLRKTKSSIIVNQSVLPDDAILVKPGK
jgi:hypothetical protein